MKFTKRTDYALRLMQVLAQFYTQGPIPVKSICDKSGMTLKFLQSVVSSLAKASLITAKAGSGGGISLSRQSGDITILEIVEAVEGKINLMDCLGHPQSCHGHQGCSIMCALFAAQESMVSTLCNITLKNMVDAEVDPANRVPDGHYQNPSTPCPLLQ